MVIRKNSEDIKKKQRRGEENRSRSREKEGEDQNAIGAGFIVTTQTLPENENQAWKQTIRQNHISRQHNDPKKQRIPTRSHKIIQIHQAPPRSSQHNPEPIQTKQSVPKSLQNTKQKKTNNS
jgi:hypothetical protein